MKWIVEGANPTTGRELVREVQAETKEDAERLASDRGMLVSAVRPATDVCANCNSKIGSLERPKEFNSAIVCETCFRKLSPSQLDYSSPSSEKLPLRVAATVPGVAFICPNPNCRFEGLSIREKRGNDLVGFILLLVAIVPGILYFMFCYGKRDVCPKCGMELKL